MAKSNMILDASGIIRSSLDFSKGGFEMPPSVRAEIRGWAAHTAVEEAIAKGDIRVTDPEERHLKKVREAASKTGDDTVLSGADIDVLAVALKGAQTILTDDYAIQNTAAKLGLKTQPVTHDGIKKQVTWVFRCGGCGKKATGPGICDVCGHKAKKSPE
jgi:endoribonuclease Nob1